MNIENKKCNTMDSVLHFCLHNIYRQSDWILQLFLKIFAKKVKLCEVMEQFIFLGQKSKDKPISRIQAFRIISSAAKKCLLSQKVSCHSLRKTFGYHAWKKGVSPALLTSIYNHSSYKITTRYLGIDQDDRDEVFCLVNLQCN